MPGPTTAMPRPRRHVPVAVSALARHVGARIVAPGSGDRPGDELISGVALATQAVRSGDLFAAVAGTKHHGAAFAASAATSGAVAVLTDPAGLTLLEGVELDLPVLVVADPRRCAAAAAALVYGEPSKSLDVIGVTGTSGKTTTTFLVRAALAAAGRSSGLIGTVGTFVGDQPLASSLTTPEAPDLQALLAVMVEAGSDSVVMEVSSHALRLQRVSEVDFAQAAFTNLSQDHLDFHTDLEDYFEAKAMLFDGRARRHLVVVDDSWGVRLAARLGTDVVTLGTGASRTPGDPGESGRPDWTIEDVVTTADGSTGFTALGPDVRVPMGCRIPGAYNVANALLALAIAVEAGVPADIAAAAISAAQVPGRMERIDAGQDFLAVVDYSHKPAAVEGALKALRPLTDGRLIVVLGCGGDRDRGKRPLMGQVAARDADVLIVTDDNPRSEDPAAIRAEVLAGASDVPGDRRGEVAEIGSRGRAIEHAVALADRGDTVLVAGKGHETGQDVGGVIHPFDDRAVLRSALSARLAATR